MLQSGTRGFFQIEFNTFNQRLISRSENSFDLGQNGEALVVATPDADRILFTCLSEQWYCYIFSQDTWVHLGNWSGAQNGSAHLVIIPDGPTALYHIDDEPVWKGVRL